MQTEIKTEVSSNSKKDQKPFAVRWYGARHTQALMLSFATANAFGTRAILSVAIVAMTTPNTSPNVEVPTYTWTNQNVILSAYYWGYVLPQLVMGHFAKKYGVKWFLAASAIIASLSTIVIPFVAQYGSWSVMLCLCIQGFAQAMLFPCCHSMIAKWIPAHEKSRISALVYGAGMLGIAISMLSTGWVCGTSAGWPYSFYGGGVLGLIWSVLWIILGKESPKDHNRIDPEERKYIEQSVHAATHTTPVATPWKKIITSVPVWSIIISSWGQIWGFITLLTNIPRYSAKILGYNIRDNGALSATPYFLFWVLSFCFSILSDYLIRQKIVTIKVARIIMNSIGFLVPGFTLLLLAILCSLNIANTGITLATFIISIGVNSAVICGHNLSHIDVAPAYAGVLMGIANGLGNTAAILAPLTVQFIVVDETDAFQWSIIFYVSAGLYILTNTVYIVFSSGDIQEWNCPSALDNEKNIEMSLTTDLESADRHVVTKYSFVSVDK